MFNIFKHHKLTRTVLNDNVKIYLHFNQRSLKSCNFTSCSLLGSFLTKEYICRHVYHYRSLELQVNIAKQMHRNFVRLFFFFFFMVSALSFLLSVFCTPVNVMEEYYQLKMMQNLSWSAVVAATATQKEHCKFGLLLFCSHQDVDTNRSNAYV